MAKNRYVIGTRTPDKQQNMDDHPVANANANANTLHQPYTDDPVLSHVKFDKNANMPVSPAFSYSKPHEQDNNVLSNLNNTVDTLDNTQVIELDGLGTPNIDAEQLQFKQTSCFDEKEKDNINHFQHSGNSRQNLTHDLTLTQDQLESNFDNNSAHGFPFPDNTSCKEVQFDSFDYKRLNPRFYHFFEIYKQYLNSENSSQILNQLLRQVNNFFKNLTKLLEFKDKEYYNTNCGDNEISNKTHFTDLINSNRILDVDFDSGKKDSVQYDPNNPVESEVCNYHIFVIFMHSDSWVEEQAIIYSNILSNVKVLFTTVFSRSAALYNSPYLHYNNVYTLFRQHYESLFLNNPVLYYSDKMLLNEIQKVIDQNEQYYTDFFFNKVDFTNKKVEFEYYEKMRAIEFDQDEALDYESIYTNESMLLSSNIHESMSKVQQNKYDVTLKAKILQRLTMDVKARFNTDYHLDLSADSARSRLFLVTDTFKQQWMVVDYLKYLICNFDDSNESVQVTEFKNYYNYKEKNYEYIKFKLNYKIYCSAYALKIYVMINYDFDYYRLNKAVKEERSASRNDSLSQDFSKYQEYFDEKNTVFLKMEQIRKRISLELYNKQKSLDLHAKKTIYSDDVNKWYVYVIVLLFLYTLGSTAYTISKLSSTDFYQYDKSKNSLSLVQSIDSTLKTAQAKFTAEHAISLTYLDAIELNSVASFALLDANNSLLDTQTSEVTSNGDTVNTLIQSATSSFVTSASSNLSAVTGSLSSSTATLIASNDSKLASLSSSLSTDLSTTDRSIQAKVNLMETVVASTITISEQTISGSIDANF